MRHDLISQRRGDSGGGELKQITKGLIRIFAGFLVLAYNLLAVAALAYSFGLGD